MRKLILLAAMALAVAACSYTTSGLTEAEKEQLTVQDRVFALKGEFGIIMERVAVYASQPPCTEVVVMACSETQVVQGAHDSALRVLEALDTAEAMARAGAGVSAENWLSTAQALNATLLSYLITEGVQ